jgi:non-ribosomal peptide synthetase component F
MHDYPLKQRTIGHLLADKAARVGDRTWLIFAEQRYTYAQAHELSNRYANGFHELGIGKGDHVAVMLPNCSEFIWTIWGLAKLGAVTVPLNTAARGELLSQQNGPIVWLKRWAATIGCGRALPWAAPEQDWQIAGRPASISQVLSARRPMSRTARPCSPAIRNTSCTHPARQGLRRA